MKRRGDGEGSIGRRYDGRWRARLRVFDPLTGLYKRLEWDGKTRADVLEKLDAARGRVKSNKPAKYDPVVLSHFLRSWLEDVVKTTKRETTQALYEHIIENYLIPSRLGTMKLADLRTVQIQHVLVASSKATLRTQQLCLIVLRRALAQAVKWEVIESNPVVGIVPPTIIQPERRVLSAKQARALIEATKPDRLHALYYLALDTGMREGELFALQWGDVDMERGSIRVVRTVNTATGTLGPPKTKSSRRRIDIGPGVRAVLAAHKRRMKAEGYSGPLVFPSTGGRHLSPSNVRIRSFLPAQKAAKIDPPIRFHDLRHTAATLMLEGGLHPKVVSERLGHANIAITADLYQHVSETMQKDAAKHMDSILGKQPMGGKRGGQTSAKGSAKKRKKAP